ncbi:MAG: V-type ATPase 116kDa subunit family protein [Candidatus Nezhaarchaeales archaeon]|nr:MAG: hypothetical protein DSO05_05035 [Candidatus Nezhaarchaeota archaeon WYZ-LMO7]
MTPLIKVKVYVLKDHLAKVLFHVGKEGFLHLTDVKEDFPEEVAKGILRPFDVSSILYRISSLISKLEKLVSTIKLPSYSLESLAEEEIFSISLLDSEAYVDALERSLVTGDELIAERVKKEHGEKISKLITSLKVLETIESAKAKAAETAAVAVFTGWLPKTLLKSFVKVVEKASYGCHVVKYEEPEFHEKTHLFEKPEEEKHEVVNLRFYVPKEYVENILYALSKLEHSVIDLRSLSYAEFEDKVKPLEPSPNLFRLSSLSSRLDVLLSMLGLRPPQDVKPISEPLLDERINEIDSIVSSIEKEVFSLSSRLESIKKSMDTASRLESDVSALVTPQIQLAEVIAQDIKGTIRSMVLQLSDESAKIHALLDEIKREKGDQLIEFKRLIEGARMVEEKRLKMVATDNMAIIQISVAKEDVEKAKLLVKEASSNNFACIEVSRPIKVKVKKETAIKAVHEIKIPSLMRNPKWARVYEGLVKGLGTLNYKEIDPTIIWFFTFPIFFGLMFPDVGHGLVLLILSIPLYYLKKKGYRGGELTNYIVQGAPVIIACAITSIIFGIAFGEFFGKLDPHPEHYHPLKLFNFDPLNSDPLATLRATILSALGLPQGFDMLEAEGAKALIKLSIYIAIFHITLGLVFSVINRVRLREYKETIMGPGLWLWLYASVATAFIIYRGRLVSAVLEGYLDTIIFIWMPFIAMMIIRIIFMGLLDGISESLDNFIASLSNTISYARLFAFALVHAVLSHVFLSIDEGLYAMIGVPFIGAIAGTIFFVFFEIIFVFFQALRLHWVEHGTKFLIADGTPFQPFTISLSLSSFSRE